MKKIMSICLLLITLAACKTEPYIKHDLDIKKLADNCDQVNASVKMISNIAGERFEFEACLPADFSADQLTVTKNGDDAFVNIPGNGKAATTAFKLVLDVKAYPKYKTITIGGETYHIAPVK